MQELNTLEVQATETDANTASIVETLSPLLTSRERCTCQLSSSIADSDHMGLTTSLLVHLLC